MVGVGYLGSGELSSRQGNVHVFTHRQLDDRSRGFRDVYRALPGSSCDGTKPDSSVLALAACVFSFGALIIASGMYVKARGLQSAAASAPESKNSARRVRGGCELCGSDTPVIQCKVHQLHLCPACLAQHYDFRSCAYVPSTRRTTGKTTGKTAGKQKGATKARSAAFS